MEGRGRVREVLEEGGNLGVEGWVESVKGGVGG